jgi:hypothetical protein
VGVRRGDITPLTPTSFYRMHGSGHVKDDVNGISSITNICFIGRIYPSLCPTAIENFPFFPLPILWDYSKVTKVLRINVIAGPEKLAF